MDPGTCNVCSAPCSSCLHVKQTRMEPKIAESLDETSRESAISYSVDDTVQTKKNRECKSSQHTTSEASNMISVNSNLDSCNENAGRKHTNISGAAQDVEVPNKVFSGRSVRGKLHTPSPHKKDAEQGNSISKFADARGLEGHDDNISCVSGSDEASNMSNSSKGISDTKVATTSTASPSILASEEHIKPDQSQEASFMDKHELEGVQNKSSGEVVSRAVSGLKSASYASRDIQDNQICHVGGNSEPSAMECTKVEAGADSDDLPTKIPDSLGEKKESEETSELLALPEVSEKSMHSDPVNDSDESDILEHDVSIVAFTTLLNSTRLMNLSLLFFIVAFCQKNYIYTRCMHFHEHMLLIAFYDCLFLNIITKFLCCLFFLID